MLNGDPFNFKMLLLLKFTENIVPPDHFSEQSPNSTQQAEATELTQVAICGIVCFLAWRFELRTEKKQF